MLFTSKVNLCNIFWPLFTKLVLFLTEHFIETALVLCIPAELNTSQGSLGYPIIKLSNLIKIFY